MSLFAGSTGDILTQTVMRTLLIDADDLPKLAVKDQSGSGSFALELLATETLGADRALTLIVNDAARTIDLTGNLTLASNFTTTGNFTTSLTQSANVTLTLPGSSDTLVGLATSDILTNKTLTAPDINGGTVDAVTSLGIRSTGAAFDLILASSAVYGANRTLTINIPTGSDQALTLVGDLVTAGGAFDLTLTMTATTNVTLPTSGTLITNSVATLSSLTSIGTIVTGVWNASVISPVYGGTGLASITDGGIMLGSGTGNVTVLAQATNGQIPVGSTGADPVLATVTATANETTVANGAGTITIGIADDVIIPTSITIPNTGLHILDTNASHDLIIKPGSDISADRTLTITTGDADRTFTISANVTVDQDVDTTATPTFANIIDSGLTASKPVFTTAGKQLTSTGTLAVDQGGTGATSLTDGGLLLGSGTGAVTQLAQATNGQLPIGSTGADPVLAVITGTSNRITVTLGGGTIGLDLEQDIHTGATPTFAGGTFTGDTELKLLNLTDETELTLDANGEVTVTQSVHKLLTNAGGGTDDLEAITGGSTGDILIIRASDATKTIVAQHGGTPTGGVALNLASGVNFTMDEDDDFLVLCLINSLWQEISRSENHA